MGKICDFWPISRCISVTVRDRAYITILITNKSYTGSRLPPISMTLNDFERLNWGFYGFFGDFGLRNTFQERIALRPIEIDIDKLRMKILALNVNFDSLSLDFLGSRKSAYEGIKERYPH